MPQEYDIDPNDIQLLDRPGFSSNLAPDAEKSPAMPPELKESYRKMAELLDKKAEYLAAIEKSNPYSGTEALPAGQRPTLYNRSTGKFEEIDPTTASIYGIPLGRPGRTGEHEATSGSTLYPHDPWKGLGTQALQAGVATQMAKAVKDKGDDKALAREAMDSFERHIQSELQAEAEKRYPRGRGRGAATRAEANAIQSHYRKIRGGQPGDIGQICNPLGPPRATGEHAPEGGVIFSSEPWKDLGASNEPGVPAWYNPEPDQLDIDPKDIQILPKQATVPQAHQTPYGAEQEKMISGLNPDAQPYVREALDEANKAFAGTGIEARLKSGYRSPEEQDKIYARVEPHRERSKPMPAEARASTRKDGPLI